MRLKKLLSGVTAAIMILSSVVIASFSSVVSADVEGISPPTGGWWTNDKQQDTSKYTLFEDYSWTGKGNVPALQGATELYIAFQMIKVSTNKPLVAWLNHQNEDNSNAWTSFDVDEATPLVRLDKERGTYVVHWKGSAISNTKLMHLSVQFAYADPNGDGAQLTEEVDKETGKPTGRMVPEPAYNTKYCDTSTNFTLLGVYTKEPDYNSLPQPPEAEPTEPIPEGALPVYLVDNEQFPLTTNRADVTGDGTYTIEATDLNNGADGTALVLYSENANQIISEDAKVVINKILINGETYEVPRYWGRSPVSVYPEVIGAPGLYEDHFSVCPWNPWWDDSKNPHNISIKYPEEIVFHEVSITFTVSDTGLSGDVGKPSTPSDNPDVDKPSGGSDNNPSGKDPSNPSNPTKPTNPSNPTNPTGGNVKKTTSPAQKASEAKATAEKAMKQAKITKLTAKAKGKKKINVTWKKVAKATGYEVQASTKKNFKKDVIKKTTTKNKLVIKKLKSKKKYFVRVRAYATYKDAKGKTQKVCGSWFKIAKKVKVK